LASQAWEKSNRYRWGCVLLLIAVSFGVYANSLTGSFVATDHVRWEDRPWARGMSMTSMFRELLIPDAGAFYRPIPYMVHVVDYHLWGATPMGFHITNTTLHAVVGVLVYFVAAAILGYGLAPLIVALLFATHPVHTEAVTYIAGRTDVTMGIFFLVSLLLYIRFRKSAGTSRHFLYAGSVLAFILALLCKEAAVALPLVLVLYEIYFGSGRTGKSLWKRLVPPLAPLVAIGLLYSVVASTTGLGEAFTLDRIGFGLQGLTAARALHRYSHLLLFPVNLSFTPDFPWSRSFSQPHALLPLISVVLLLITIFVTYRFSKVLSFGLAWVVVTILPISNLLAVTRFPVPLMAERYLYVPSIGFCMAVGAVIHSVAYRPARVPRGGLYTKIGLVSLTVLLVAYTSLAVRRNLDWRSQHSLAAKTLEQNPKAVEAHLVLADAYCEKGMYDKAIVEFRRALLRTPSSARAYLGLGITYGKKGEYGSAISEIRQAIALDPEFADAYHSLGAMYCHMGRIDDGIAQYHKALALSPYSAQAHNSLGNAQLMKGNLDQAISRYQIALGINPDLIGVRMNLAHAYVRNGKTEEAISECRRTLAIDPDCAQAHGCLGNAHIVRGSVDEAFSEYQQALTIDPDLPWPHVSLALIYRLKGNYELAIVHCDKATELGAVVDSDLLESLKPYR